MSETPHARSLTAAGSTPQRAHSNSPTSTTRSVTTGRNGTAILRCLPATSSSTRLSSLRSSDTTRSATACDRKSSMRYVSSAGPSSVERWAHTSACATQATHSSSLKKSSGSAVQPRRTSSGLQHSSSWMGATRPTSVSP